MEKQLNDETQTRLSETPSHKRIRISSKAAERKFSIANVAQALGVHPSTVSRLMDGGKLAYYQIGARRVVGEQHLEQYLEIVERKAKVRPLIH